SPGGERLLSAGEDQTVLVWEATPVLGPALAPKSEGVPLEQDRVWCVAYAPDVGSLAFAGDDAVVRTRAVCPRSARRSRRARRSQTRTTALKARPRTRPLWPSSMLR